MANSFIQWQGGKSRLAAKIIPMFPEHHCYVEVFAGAAWVMFRKPESAVEVINDINSELTTLFRVVKLHLEEFIRTLKWLLVSRDQFNIFMNSPPETLTDIQRAVRFYYVMRCGFGGKAHGQNFTVSPSARPKLNFLQAENDLAQAHLRLSRVYIENRPYAKLLALHDRADTFFYLDPPYYNCEDDYGKNLFSKEDFTKLRDMLKELKGKFLLSINDTPEIRAIFKDFRVKEVATTYTISKKTQRVGELLFSNYELPV